MPGPTVWIADTAAAAMRAEAERAHPDETGGMLLGWTNPDENLTAVCTVTGPGPTATHNPTSFEPDTAWQQQHLDAIYAATDGAITFIGDWHTHPSGGFGMSRRDRRTMRHTARTTAARTPHPLMGLLARTADDTYRLGIWTWAPSIVPFSQGTATPLDVRSWTPTPDDQFWDNPGG